MPSAIVLHWNTSAHSIITQASTSNTIALRVALVNLTKRTVKAGPVFYGAALLIVSSCSKLRIPSRQSSFCYQVPLCNAEHAKREADWLD